MIYLQTLGITNSDQLFQTLSSAVINPIMTQPVLIYLYGNGCNGKTRFRELLDEAIERVTGHLPFMISSENMSLNSVGAQVTIDNPSNLIHLSEVYDPVKKLNKILAKINEWSQNRDINRCYIMLSNVPLDDEMKQKVVYCEFTKSFNGQRNFEINEDMIEEVMAKLVT